MAALWHAKQVLFLNKLRILLYKPSTFEFRPTAQQKHLYTTLSNSLSAFFLSTTYTFVMYSSNPSAPQKYADAPTSGQAPVMGVPVNSYQPQAAPFQIQSSAPVPWSTGLCDCGDDVGNCKKFNPFGMCHKIYIWILWSSINLESTKYFITNILSEQDGTVRPS